MKKITTLLLLLVVTFSQSQVLSSVRTNGGSDHHAANRTVTDWLHYDDGINGGALGMQSGTYTLGAYIRLTTNLLNAHINRQIEEVKFYLSDSATNITGNVTIEIYTSLSSPAYTEDFPVSGLTAGDWNTVTLSTPFQIDGSELLIGYKYTGSGYIAGLDDGTNFVTTVNYYKLNGGGFTSLESSNISKNFNIQVGVGGATSANDAGISNIDIDNAIQVGNIDIVATISNYGSNTLNSIDFNYKVDNGSVQTDNLTGLNLATGQSTTVTHSVPWNATSGSHTLDVFVSNFNGNGADDIAANDHQTKTVLVVNEIFPKTVVYEEGTGTWCGWCVRGIAGLKDMAHFHGSDFIGIAVHGNSSTGGVDPMNYSDYVGHLGVSGFPSGKMDRKPNEIDPGYDSLEPAYLNEKQETPVAKIAITNKNWDAGTRELTVEVTSTFALDIPNANYNASLIIIEDGVTGTTSSYAQHNYYSNSYDLTDWEGTNYKNLPDPIPASDMVYNHVARTIVGGWNGVAGSIPASVTYNTPYTYTFTYTVPANYDENNLKMVAIILDNSTGQIVNGVEEELDAAGVNEFFNDNQVEIYPNPSTGIFNVAGAKNMTIAVYDILGHQIINKKISEEISNISLNNFPKGLYFVKFTKGEKSGVKKIVLK